MELICTQENLSQGLSIVGNIPEKNINLPILENVYLKAKKNIILSATNLEIGVECTIRGKIQKEGDFTVPVRTFVDYVNLLDKDNITIRQKGKELEVFTSHNKARFRGAGGEDFPLMPDFKKNKEYEVGLEEFEEAVGSVIFAVSSSGVRPEIEGVYLEFDKKNLILAATDSFRLAEKKVKLLSSETENKVIIPARTLSEVLRVLKLVKNDQEKGSLKIAFSSDNQVLFTISDYKTGMKDNIKIISKLIEGKYPEYKEIIPKNFSTQITVDKNDFIKAIKTGSLFVKKGINGIKLIPSAKNKELSVFSVNNETGEGVSKITGKIDGQNSEISLNYRYLLEGLQNIKGEQVFLGIVNKDTPCYLGPVDRDGYLYIIMPIRE